MDVFLGWGCSWRNVYWKFLVKSWVWSWPLAKWQWYIINPNWTFIRLSCNVLKFMCDVLRDLVSFVQFKKREKHPWRSATFSKACHFTKSNTPLWVFFTIFKLYTWYQITQSITHRYTWPRFFISLSVVATYKGQKYFFK